VADDRELLIARLRLRRWRPEDVAPVATINRDTEVTSHLNRSTDELAVAAFYVTAAEHWAAHGFGFYAVDVVSGPSATDAFRGPSAAAFIGFVGVAYPSFLPALSHRPELGWRLAREAWGQGFATEAAAAARDDAFDRLGLDSLISIIHPENVRSQRLAAKLGMSIRSRVHDPALGREVDVWQVPTHV